ncbi:hypothetical protein UFOVP1491_45 [uncultured Caudovirales phage]|uniref:Uncharacterized protein n=1 Tax=uncultured Caudovirales phage TaxID=2100421 RepID=A0A6J5MVU8_9CAUD|nr:hypothetical protein UFOVP485_76 [uncultured Caudovirales phage]CAB4150788.1 hypothetical protein UFOVP575_28 [uncultured Caudovirales phage]CAB4175207.1 hypothetical protein UFOVP963_132 [uncultured Caudovirales phage]CAB4179668.1 hypothetical protein UFOVP1032_45 [uncultured Caudovirales phage]CAB4185795.1 hypothetical protein UFOVP1125_113 [uncultured Caudovirales phage]
MEPNLSLAKKLFVGRFFSNDRLSNHRLVDIISINDETEMVQVVLQKYNITKSANASTGKHLIFNSEIPFEYFKEMF